MRMLESICLEQAMPNRDVAGSVAVSLRRRVKYENSSVDLRNQDRVNNSGRVLSRLPRTRREVESYI